MNQRNEFQKSLDLLREGMIDEAYEVLLSIVSSNSDSDQRIVALALCNMASINVCRSNMLKARELYENAANIYFKLGDIKARASVLASIGSTYRDTNEYDEAMDNYFAALDLYESIDDDVAIADQLTNIAYIYSMIGDPENAVNYYFTASEIFQKLHLKDKDELCKKNIKYILG